MIEQFPFKNKKELKSHLKSLQEQLGGLGGLILKGKELNELFNVTLFPNTNQFSINLESGTIFDATFHQYINLFTLFT